MFMVFNAAMNVRHFPIFGDRYLEQGFLGRWVKEGTTIICGAMVGGMPEQQSPDCVLYGRYFYVVKAKSYQISWLKFDWRIGFLINTSKSLFWCMKIQKLHENIENIEQINCQKYIQLEAH